MSLWTQLCLLIGKNITLRKRQPVSWFSFKANFFFFIQNYGLISTKGDNFC